MRLCLVDVFVCGFLFYPPLNDKASVNRRRGNDNSSQVKGRTSQIKERTSQGKDKDGVATKERQAGSNRRRFRRASESGHHHGMVKPTNPSPSRSAVPPRRSEGHTTGDVET